MASKDYSKAIKCFMNESRELGDLAIKMSIAANDNDLSTLQKSPYLIEDRDSSGALTPKGKYLIYFFLELLIKSTKLEINKRLNEENRHERVKYKLSDFIHRE